MSDKKESPPKHIAIIMDGNGRWAKSKGLPRWKGHEAGAESVRRVIEACVDAEVEYLTLFAFSTENWNRPKTEVNALMKLCLLYTSPSPRDATLSRMPSSA